MAYFDEFLLCLFLLHVVVHIVLAAPYQLLEYQTDMRRCRFDTLGKQTSAHLAGFIFLDILDTATIGLEPQVSSRTDATRTKGAVVCVGLK